MGRAYAIRHLDVKNLPPSLWFKLGREHRVSTWLQRAFNSLLSSPMREMSDVDCQRIGLEGLAVLIRARDWINYHRVGISLIPPAIPEQGPSSCPSHDQCLKVWRDTWIKAISPEILNPVTPLLLSTIPDRVRNMRHGGMSRTCKAEAVLRVMASDSLQVETALREKAMQKIHDIYNVVYQANGEEP
jgi:hypothetical protein